MLLHMSPAASRMEFARRRVQITRYAVGIVAAGAFAGGVALARSAHPGSQGHQQSTSAQAAIPSESSAVAAAGESSGLGSSTSSGGSVSTAPAASPPVVQSAGS
jgi:hypothetical protein